MTDKEKTSNKLTKVGYAAKGLMQSIEEAEMLAEKVVNSSTFGKAFEKVITITDDTGKPILDDEGNPLTKKEKNKADVVAAIVLGTELGISPMAAITLGARLDADAYTKVLRGKKLGLDPMTSINMINIINGVVSTGTHVVTGVLLKNNIKFKFIKDFDPVYGYKDSKGRVVDFDEDKHIEVNSKTTKEKLQTAIKSGKTPVFKKIVNRVTSAIFIREGYEELSITYSLQDATDAGLYKGVNSEGESVDGKPNWNNHPRVILRGRVLLIGGRIIAADFLDGMYSNEEAEEITGYTILDDEEKDKNEDFTDAQEVKDDSTTD